MIRTTRMAALAALLGLAACGDDTSPTSTAASVEVRPRTSLLVGVGDTLRLEARVLDSAHSPVESPSVTWTTSDPNVAVFEAGGLLRAVGAGQTTLSAEVDGVFGSGSVEVYVPPDPDTWTVGTSYFGRRDYVEYIPGDLPLVISAPHGGNLEPSEIEDRTFGTTVTDSNTRETTLALRQALLDRTGRAPHVILSRLRRTKLDPNREIVEAAQENIYAEQAWRDFQGFIETARQIVVDAHGTGLYVDLHGHGHPILRAELGYLLSADDLARSDAELDAPVFAEQSSIRALWHETDVGFAALLRGENSLGGRMADAGLRAVPSPGEPSPGDDPYFTGGYNTARHGSREDGVGVSGVQIEMPFAGWRDTAHNRGVVAAGLARALEGFLAVHYGFVR